MNAKKLFKCLRALRAFGLHSAIAVGLSVGLAGPSSAVEGACKHEPMSAEFLSCVRHFMQATEGHAPIKNTVTSDPLEGLLEELAATIGYRGDAGDLEYLKRWSQELKKDPIANQEAIAALDNAIASHADEIRTALSTRKLANEATGGANIHPQFVLQKLEFLDSDRAKFYDRGPFEVTRRTLLANALEETFFLEQKAGRPDKDKLRREIEIIDEILVRYTQPGYDYLLPPRLANSEINSNMFWQASLWFVLGETAKARELFGALARKNHKFGLETTNAGHIFIYRIFDLPYEMIVRPNYGHASEVEIKDPNLVKRYYNPAQLALLACAHLDVAGPQGAGQLIRAIKALSFADYYVVVSAASSSDKLQKLDVAIRQSGKAARMVEREKLHDTVAGLAGDFPYTMERGAQQCGIEAEVRDAIYSPFRFQTEIRHIAIGTEKQNSYLLLGGRLNSAQAAAVANFVNGVVFAAAEIGALQEELGTTDQAYAARMAIDQ